MLILFSKFLFLEFISNKRHIAIAICLLFVLQYKCILTYNNRVVDVKFNSWLAKNSISTKRLTALKSNTKYHISYIFNTYIFSKGEKGS